MEQLWEICIDVPSGRSTVSSVGWEHARFCPKWAACCIECLTALSRLSFSWSYMFLSSLTSRFSISFSRFRVSTCNSSKRWPSCCCWAICYNKHIRKLNSWLWYKMLWAVRIRGFTTMRYINRLFTYLLTYLLTNITSTMHSRNHPPLGLPDLRESHWSPLVRLGGPEPWTPRPVTALEIDDKIGHEISNFWINDIDWFFLQIFSERLCVILTITMFLFRFIDIH